MFKQTKYKQQPRRVYAKLPDDARQIPFVDPGTYATPSGDIYREYYNGRFIKLRYTVIYGYSYCGLFINGKRVTVRVHRVIAQTWLPNPDPSKYTIVMHIDNNKQNNDVSNLKWGTISENTKQAFADGLAQNAKGYNDSQSLPVIMCEAGSDKILGHYGSMRAAARETGASLATISRQCKAPNGTKFRTSTYFKYDHSNL